MTTDRDSDYCEISCDGKGCEEYVSERNFHDAKDVIDSMGWKTYLVNDDWCHKCKECQMDDEEARAESIMDRYTP